MNEKYRKRMKVWLLISILPIIAGTMMLLGIYFTKSLSTFVSGIIEYLIAIYAFYHVMINWSLSKQKETLW